MDTSIDGAETSEFPLPAYRNLSQVVSLSLEEGECAEDIVASTVRIVSSSSNQKKRPSSRLTLKSEVDYSWEDKYYGGQLVAIHLSRNVLAYAISGDRQTRDGAVRLINKQGSGRELIKNLRGPVQDLAFSLLDSPILLAVVDETANLLIYQIKLDESSLTAQLMMKVLHDIKPQSHFSHKVRWIPFVPDDDDGGSDFDKAKMIALIIGPVIEVYQVEDIFSTYGNKPLRPSEVGDLVVIIEEHKDDITDASFSPDGTAIATISLDGTMQFFQLYMDVKPKCLHNWLPHNGQPLTFMHFLDNLKSTSPESLFWKFLISGANDNTELKLWRCNSWSHIQTISISNPTRNMKLKAAIDSSASYLLLSDQVNEVLYLFTIQIDTSVAYINTVSAYLVPFSILSYAIVDVSSHYLKADDSDDLSDYEDEEDIVNHITMSLYLLHSKSLQDCKIQIQLPKSGGQLLMSALAPDQPVLPIPITLMTPKELTSPAKPPENQTELINVKIEPTELATSGASSPSQEVRDIFDLQVAAELAKLTTIFPSEPEEIVEKHMKNTDIPPPEPIKVDWSKINVPDQPPNKISPKVFRRDSLSKTKTNIEVIEQTNNIEGPLQGQKDIHKKLDTILAQIKDLQKVKKREDVSIPALDRSLDTHIARLNEQLRSRDKADRDRQEAVMYTISQAVENLLAVKLEEVVPLEIRKNLIPAVLSDFEPFKRSLHAEMTQQLSATDHLLKENISKLVNSKSVMDVLASSLTSVTRNAFSGICKEQFNSFLLPRLEKLLEKTFQQVHESFSSGIRECMTAMRNDVDRVLNEMKRCEASLKNATDSKKGAISQIVNQTEASLLSTGEKVSKQIVETIQREIKLGKLALESSPASRAITPAIQVHERQALISQYMAAGQYNNAFQEALSASDLNMVVYICERISAEQLFKSTVSPLQQPVLLSLIQQVTADLSKNTELKCSYLTEAVLRLEPNHPTTSEHLPAVIAEVDRNISNYLLTHPNTKSATDLHRTVMVLKILLAGKRS